MTTISFSVEDNLKRDFTAWAKREKKSQSDMFRQLYKDYQEGQEFSKTVRRLRAKYAPAAEAEGLLSVDDVAEYLRQP